MLIKHAWRIHDELTDSTIGQQSPPEEVQLTTVPI
jgi:hypothetical protein